MANTVPDFSSSDYLKFFSAGALAATLTHGVSILRASVTPFPANNRVGRYPN